MTDEEINDRLVAIKKEETIAIIVAVSIILIVIAGLVILEMMMYHRTLEFIKDLAKIL